MSLDLFETERLVLRALTQADYEPLAEFFRRRGALTILLLFGVTLFTIFDSAEKYLVPWAYRRPND